VLEGSMMYLIWLPMRIHFVGGVDVHGQTHALEGG